MLFVNIGRPLVFESEEYLLSWGSKAVTENTSADVLTVQLAPGGSDAFHFSFGNAMAVIAVI